MSEEKVYVSYDGALGGEVRVRVDAQTTAHFTAERPLLPLPASAATSLLSPAVGGGHYHRAIPVEEAARRFGVRVEGQGGLQELAILKEVTVKNYLPKGASPEASPVVCLVLDPRTVQRLKTAAAEPTAEPVQTSAPPESSSVQAEPATTAAAAPRPRSIKRGGAR